MAESKVKSIGEKEPATLKVLAIFTSPEKGAPMIAAHDAVTVDGRGIIGDRYPDRGYYHQVRIPDENRGISIISSRGIDEANAELQERGIDPFIHEQTRRNLVVDIDVEVLNSLKRQEI